MMHRLAVLEGRRRFVIPVPLLSPSRVRHLLQRGPDRSAHPVLNEAISSVLRYAQKGSDPLVLLIALANGLGEEFFFRGALFAAFGDRHAVLASTASTY